MTALFLRSPKADCGTVTFLPARGIGYGYYYLRFQEKKTWTNTPDYQKIYDRHGPLGLISLSLSFQIKWVNIEYRIVYTQKPKTIYDEWRPMHLICVGLEFRDVF